MDKLFRKLTFRTVKSNFKQFISVILIVFLGVMLLSGFITNSYTLKKSINRYFDSTNLAKTWLYVDKVTAADEEFFTSNNINYDKRLYIETSADIKDKTASGNAKIYVSKGTISNPYVESGIRGCLIDKNVAESYGLDITFDYITFSISRELAPGVSVDLDLEFNISGTMSLDECADTYSAWPVFIEEGTFLSELNSKLESKLVDLDDETKATLAALGVSASSFELSQVPYNQILLTSDDEETLAKVNSYYENSETNLFYTLDRDSVESVVLLSSEITQSRRMIYVFPVIFLIVSILVILTTIDQLILQEKQKIGTLKSLGVPDRKILRHYSKFGAILCMIGALFGIVLGVLIIPRIMFIKYNLVYSIPSDYVSLKVPFLWLALVLVGIILLGYLVSLLTCYKILHKKPIECLRYDVGAKSSKFSKNKGKFKKVPLSIKMATRNIKLKPARTLMATLGIAGCVALLLCGFGIGNTLSHSVNNDYGKVFKFDVSTTFASENFEENLTQMQGLNSYELYERYYAEASFENKIKNVTVYSIEPNSKFTDFHLESGEAFVSKSVADSFGLKVGQEIEMSVGGVSERVTVSVIGETSVMNGIYVAKPLPFSSVYETSSAWISCEDPNEAVKFINSINGTNSAKTMQDLIDSANSKISSINLMTNTLEFFAIMLAVIVLLNLIFLILKERTRELATLKVLGKDMINITLSIYFEVLFMVIIGLIFGMALGYPLLVLVLMVNKVEVVNFLYHINILSYFLTVLIVLLTQILMTAFSYIKVKKINMIESLKSVE